MIDLASNHDAVVDVPALLRSGNAATNGAGANLAGFNGATVLFHSGTLTDGSIACKLQEDSDSAFGTAADVAGADIVGGVNLVTLAATDDNVVKKLGYIGKKQYIRAVMTQSGATSGGTYGSIVHRGHPVKAPK